MIGIAIHLLIHFIEKSFHILNGSLFREKKLYIELLLPSIESYLGLILEYRHILWIPSIILELGEIEFIDVDEIKGFFVLLEPLLEKIGSPVLEI